MPTTSVRIDTELRDYMKEVRKMAEKKTVIHLTDTSMSRALAKYLKETHEFEKYIFGKKMRRKRSKGGLFLI